MESLGNLIKAITVQRKPEIEAVLRAEIDHLLEQSTQRFRSGALAESLALGLQAWALIPEPKANWDYYPQSLSASFVKDYADLHDQENVHRWLEVMALMYDDPDHTDHLVLMTEGEAMLQLGDEARACAAFGKIYALYGKKGFAGHQKRYLEMLRKQHPTGA
ncbi:hypothetical protein GUF72_11985 [Xanthomonas citri pv. citri]|uniref:Uncharacterized protein n=2 Tax=Xanthomonas citri TaxID=346 RepID=A0A7U2L3Y7_XANCI|nr:hypothetical protein AB890_07180 [Xanthomonas citri pv. citri]QOX05050.1 hypothetical protein IG630_07105 [Xanthomonas sp. WG16]QYF44214.1 hypothetical protein HZS93_01503 [Xanthomonas citri]UVG61055.1 hypothetical protein Xdur_007360 [Xanthomonas citri pv. durantae]APR11683.1 hypothetical protein BI314_17440 [Xanthomonas citri pv. citri]